MENLKELKKGEILFKEGQTLESAFLVKSGRMALFQERSGHRIEMMQIKSGQIMGEHGIFGSGRTSFSLKERQSRVWD